jgi:hypothetical protein
MREGTGDRQFLMSGNKNRRWLGYLILFLYGGWFFFVTSSSALSNRITGSLSQYLPGWSATMIWASWLILLPIEQGIFSVPNMVQVSLHILLLMTCLVLPIAMRFHQDITLLVTALFFIELLWLIPQWKSKQSRDQRRVAHLLRRL